MLDFSVCAISITEFLRQSNGRWGWEGTSGASLYIWGFFGGRVDAGENSKRSPVGSSDDAAAHSRRTICISMQASAQMGDAGVSSMRSEAHICARLPDFYLTC